MSSNLCSADNSGVLFDGFVARFCEVHFSEMVIQILPCWNSYTIIQIDLFSHKGIRWKDPLRVFFLDNGVISRHLMVTFSDGRRKYDVRGSKYVRIAGYRTVEVAVCHTVVTCHHSRLLLVAAGRLAPIR